MANFYLAFDLELSIVPVLNKIDLPAADPEKVAEQVQQVRGSYQVPIWVPLDSKQVIDW